MNSGYSGILPGWTQGDMVDLIAKCENEGKGDDAEVIMGCVSRLQQPLRNLKMHNVQTI